MKKRIYNKYSKEVIPTLPLVAFTGSIRVIDSVEDAMDAVEFLLKQNILGVDTETRPSFKKGKQNQVSLLQVATLDVCFLFRLSDAILPALKPLLESTSVLMIGLSWHDDLLGLQRRMKFIPGLFIDLQHIVGRIGIEDTGLQKLYANIFGERISKKEQLSNWEAKKLTDKQQRYAATDAWACIRLYEEVLRLESTSDFEMVKIPEEENLPLLSIVPKVADRKEGDKRGKYCRLKNRKRKLSKQ